MSGGPYVAIIGPARSGTTWLHKYLRRHPGIYAPFVKEMNWFNTRIGLTHPDKDEVFRRRFEKIKARRAMGGNAPNENALQHLARYNLKTDAEYAEFYQTAAQGLPYIDVSPGYSLLPPDGFARIKTTFVDAKVIMLLRNRAAWAWSYQHLLTADRSPADAVDFANNWPDQRISFEPPKPLKAIYETARSVFAADQIHCAFTEDLFDLDRQQDTVDGISRFMGAKPFSIDGFTHETSRGTYTAIPEDFRADATRGSADDIAWARALMGRLPDSWEKDAATYL